MRKQPTKCRRWQACRSTMLVLVILVATLGAGIAPAQAQPGPSPAQEHGSSCKSVQVSVPASVLSHQVVKLPELQPLSQTSLPIHGQLCLPTGTPPKAVMLAVHGLTYDSEYWNARYQPNTYNFSQAMNKAGYGVLAIDRLGFGRSSHPPDPLLTLDAQAELVHQIIQKLRAGEFGQQFPRVALVSHSSGTGVAWLESSIYNDADAMIGTAFSNTFQNIPAVQFIKDFYPSILDPVGSKQTSSPTSIITRPHNRAKDYLYDVNNVDPNMLRYDDSILRTASPVGELEALFNRVGAIPLTSIPGAPGDTNALRVPLSNHVKNIRIPTFHINGEHDTVFCGLDGKHCNSSQELQRAENKYFSPQACFRAAVIPHAGHNLNLQRNAPRTYRTLVTFANTLFGTPGDDSKYDTYVSQCQHASDVHAGNGGRFGAVAP